VHARFSGTQGPIPDARSLPLQIRSMHSSLSAHERRKNCFDLARYPGFAAPRTAGRSANIESPPVSQWVRLLNQVAGASAEWHLPRIKSFTVTTYCGRELAGPLEVASDDKAEREERCSPCMTHLPTKPGSVPQRLSVPLAQALSTPVKNAVAKKTLAKATVRKPAPKGRSGQAHVAKRPVRRPQPGKA
jgi:hypothetical protein